MLGLAASGFLNQTPSTTSLHKTQLTCFEPNVCKLQKYDCYLLMNIELAIKKTT